MYEVHQQTALMENIKAWWWRDKLNLGDVLTPYIIRKLSGVDVAHVGKNWTDAIIYVLKHIYAHLPINWSLVFPIYFKEPSYILGVGSVLSHKSNGKAIAWGSGFLKRRQKFKGEKVVAVRGYYSEEELLKQGLPKVGVYGDPALLLPVIYPCSHRGNGKVAIIPHFSEYSEFKQKYGDKLDIVDLNNNKVENFIERLCSYSYVLSTSLHGLIISHAYNVPAIWIEDKVLEGDTFHFKYRDYFSAVGIDYYEPFHNIEEILSSNIKDFFEDNKEKYTIKADLKDIQSNLLKVAPFSILPQYMDSKKNSD